MGCVVRTQRIWQRALGATAVAALVISGFGAVPVSASPLPIPVPSTPGLVTFATMAGRVEAQSIVSTADGLLAVADKSNGQVALIDPTTYEMTGWDSLGSGEMPGDIAVAPDGSLWLPTCEGHLWQVSRSGSTIQPAVKRADFDGAGCTGGFADAPPLVAVSPADGSVWVANPDKRKVFRYDQGTGQIDEVKEFNSDAPYGGSISSIVVDQGGNAYVGYWEGARVFNPDGSLGPTPFTVTLNGSTTFSITAFVTMPNGDIALLEQDAASGLWYFGPVNELGIMAPDSISIPLTTRPIQYWGDQREFVSQLTVGPDGSLNFAVINTFYGDSAVLVQINPESGAVTEYPFDPAGATAPAYSPRQVAFTSSGLAWITNTNSGRLAVMTAASSGTGPCTDTGTVPVDVPVDCTALVSPKSTISSAQFQAVDGSAFRGSDWVPGPEDIGKSWIGTYTFRTPGVDVQQQRTTEPFTVATQTITSITPLIGPDQGGTEITITGTNFKTGMNVFLVDDPSQDIGFEADHVKVVSATTITAVMPAKLVGWPDKTPLWVGFGWTDPDNPNYLAKSPKPFSYGGMLPPTPVITQVTPDEITVGTSGQVVTITGSYFLDLMTVSFNGVPATSQTFVSATEFQAVVPPGLPVATGVLTLDPGYSLPVGQAPFTVNGPTTLASLSPTTGSVLGGELVTLTGTGFNENTVVTVDGKPLPLAAAAPAVAPAQQLSIRVPQHAVGAVDVSVQNPGFPISTLTNAFTYIASTITAISPTSGSNTGGDTLTVTGSGLEDVMQILFRQPGQPDAQAAGVHVDSDTQVRATVPPSSTAGTASVVLVLTDGSTLTAPMAFTYTGIPLPTLTSLSRTGGKVGTSTKFTVMGSGFMPNAQFMLGAAQATDVWVLPGGTQATMVFTIAAPPGVQDLTVTNPGGATATLTNAFNAHGPVTISAIDPTTGSTAGGTTVTVTGTGFTADMELNFAGFTGLPYTVTSPTELSFVTKQHAQGFVDLTIFNGDLTDNATLSNAFWYQTPTPASLSLTGISPVSGPATGGNSITLTGTGGPAGAGGVPNLSTCWPEISSGGAIEKTASSASSVTFTMPAGGPGVTSVWIVCPYVSGPAKSNSLQYTYLGPPTVTSVAPGAGALAGGQSVIVNGAAFAADVQVSFGGRPAPVTQVADGGSQATVVVPAGSAIGPVDVIVTNPGQGSATLTSGYTYQQGPTVTSVTPAQGPTDGGTLVVIAGTGFQSGAGVVVKSPADAEAATDVSVRSDTSIAATLPAFSPGLVDLVVQNPDGTQAIGVDAFTYDDTPAPLNAPTVTSISPNTGVVSGGTEVTIIGADFENAQCLVAFGGVRATTQSYVATTRMTATTPPGNPGTVDVTVTCPTAGAGTLNNGFTYSGAPTLTTVAPGSGSASGGTTVTLTGSGFGANATVFFGGNEAASVTVNSATSATAVTAAGTAGPVDVVLTNPGIGSASLANAFTFIADPTPSPTPTPSPSPTDSPTPTPSPSPTDSPTPTPSPSPTDSPSPTPSPSPSPSPTDSPTPAPAPGPAPAPAPAPVPPPPPISAPSIAAVSPFVGPVAGGTTITIAGTGFMSGAVVYVEGIPAVGVSVLASTQVTAVTPGGPPGAADVTVVNPDGGRITFGNGFTYESAPVVSGLDVRSGPVVGGTTVTITGSGFAADAVVQFGGAPAQNVRVIDGSHLSAVTPTGKLGWNTVTVTNPGIDSSDLPDGFDFEWISQQPVRALSLPKTLTADSWTTLVRLPVVTNAGERVKASVTCVPARSCEVRTRDQHLQVKAGGAKHVQVHLSAPAQHMNGYGAFRLEKTYDAKQIRRAS